MIRVGARGDSLEEVRLKMLRNLFDYKNFDVFLGTPFGKYLLEGIHDDEKIKKQGITKISEYISVNKTFYSALTRAKLDACMLDKKKKLVKRDVLGKEVPSKAVIDPKRITRNTGAVLEYYDRLLEDATFSLEETKRIQEVCKKEFQRIQYSSKTQKASTFDQICRQIQEQGPP